MVRTRHAGQRKGWFQRSLGLILLLLLAATPLAGSADGEQMFVPVGGGYSDATLEGFARVVIEHMEGGQTVVDIKVVPSTYGTSRADRRENIELAQERTDEVEAACETAATAYPGVQDCQAKLMMLFDRGQALDPDNSAPIADPETDGVFILGGDQLIAMEVLADTPAETTIAGAYTNGVVFGGTSAGAAMQSQTMLAGYTDSGWPYNALERDQIIIWWSNDGDLERGLSFGSDELITDQHFYQRGRITRLLNAIAQSDDRFGGESLLGLGVDYATHVSVSDDALISDVGGDTSVMVIDGEAPGASMAFTGPLATLSARNLLTHVLAPDDALAYDIAARQPLLDGEPVTPDEQEDWDAGTLDYAGNAALMLGGDLSFDARGPAMADFLARAEASGSQRIVIVAAAYQNFGQARTAARQYRAGLVSTGWNGTISTVAFDPQQAHQIDPDVIEGATGVIFLGGDQQYLPETLASPEFAALVDEALSSAQVVLADKAMAAAFGDWYATNPDPTDDNYQEEGIAAFHSGAVTLAPGLGIVGGAFEPRNTWDQRWGRLYSHVIQHPLTIAFGISELTAIVLEPGADPLVVGERSIAALDGRTAVASTGTNGAFTLLNAPLDLFAPGDVVVSNR